jgi:hypothetical protein
MKLPPASAADVDAATTRAIVRQLLIPVPCRAVPATRAEMVAEKAAAEAAVSAIQYKIHNAQPLQAFANGVAFAAAASIKELRCLKQPPARVEAALFAMQLAVQREPSWAGVQASLRDPQFAAVLAAVPLPLPPAVAQRVERWSARKLAGTSIADVQQCSIVAGDIYTWVLHVTRCTAAHAEMDALRAADAAAQARVDALEGELLAM